MDKIRWGVIGATGIADSRTIPEGIIPAVNSELAAVMSRTKEKVVAVSEKYDGVPWFTDVQQMLHQSDIDACYIASPPHVHRQQVEACAQAGIHVFCEKPLARDAAEVRPMVQICAEHGVKFGVGFMMRFHHMTVEAKRLVAEGALGEIVSGRAQFGFDYPPDPTVFRQNKELHKGGSFMDVGNHATDLLEFIIGTKVASVMAMTGNVIHQYWGVEDTCLALYEFENGAFGVADAYFCTDAAQNLIEINGSEATMVVEGVLGQSGAGTLRVIELTENGLQDKFIIPSDMRNMYQEEIEAFAEAVLNDTEPPVPGEDGLWSQIVLDAVYESAETGQKVPVE